MTHLIISLQHESDINSFGTKNNLITYHITTYRRIYVFMHVTQAGNSEFLNLYHTVTY